MDKVLAIDTDNVILDFLGQWEIACHEALGEGREQVSHEYDLKLRYGMTEKEVSTVWHAFNSNGHWSNMRHFEGADRAIHDLEDMGFQIHIVTSIDGSLLEARRTNFAKAGLPEHLQIHCVNGTKLRKLQELGAMCLVDDHAFHIEEALAAGVPYRVMITSRPHLQNTPAATHYMDSLRDFSNAVKSGLFEMKRKIKASPSM